MLLYFSTFALLVYSIFRWWFNFTKFWWCKVTYYTPTAWGTIPPNVGFHSPRRGGDFEHENGVFLTKNHNTPVWKCRLNEWWISIRCESRLRPELLDVMRTSNHSKCRMSQLSALFLFNIQEIVVPLSLQKSCNIKHVMAYDTKLQEISESFRLSRLWKPWVFLR